MTPSIRRFTFRNPSSICCSRAPKERPKSKEESFMDVFRLLCLDLILPRLGCIGTVYFFLTDIIIAMKRDRSEIGEKREVKTDPHGNDRSPDYFLFPVHGFDEPTI